MVGPILDDHAADGSPYARRCLILGLILAWLISPACVTFRCEVLSEGKTVAHRRYYASLNTPFGARYFPTDKEYYSKLRVLSQSQCTFWCLVLSDRARWRGGHCLGGVSMHLLVLGAFRRWIRTVPVRHTSKSQCTFWCLVLFDQAGGALHARRIGVSQCTFWCLVLSDCGIAR